MHNIFISQRTCRQEFFRDKKSNYAKLHEMCDKCTVHLSQS